MELHAGKVATIRPMEVEDSTPPLEVHQLNRSAAGCIEHW
jgi:hypothetical protein